MKKILIVNGPNLNLLGKREPEIYGNVTLDEIHDYLKEEAEKRDAEIEWLQSNYEGEIIEKLQTAREKYDGIIINPAALSYTSYGILDALLALDLPVVEVHLSNIFSREEFRSHSITASACIGMTAGLGWKSYLYALLYLLEI